MDRVWHNLACATCRLRINSVAVLSNSQVELVLLPRLPSSLTGCVMSTLKVELHGSEKWHPPESWYSESASQQSRTNEARRKRRTVGLLIGFVGLVLGAHLVHKSAHFSCLRSSLAHLPLDHSDRQAVCPQVGQLLPDSNKELWEKLSDQISTDEFKTTAIQWLSGAVQVPYVLS